MQSCQFAKSVTERGSGRLCSARPVAVLSAAFQRAVLPLQPQTVRRCWKWRSDRCVGECDCLGTHNAIQPRARPSKSNSTPRRRDGFLLLCTFFPQVVEGSVFPRGTHVLTTTWWVVIYFSVSAGRVGVSPVLVKVDFHWLVFGYARYRT